MIVDIWKSFRDLPAWVQIWLVVLLIPTNLAPLAYLDQPNGILIAALSIGGMALNLPIMLATRGMSKAMAFPHLICWVPMVFVVIAVFASEAELAIGYAKFLVFLLVIDLISLAFDVNDARVWLKSRSAK
ncbi:hypothetical protein [Ruegeria faecimaris]|uniref:hypothetical protein n=1 Tax=Ruegeria faecimaris TaxID=686389 RepID=UPI0024929988|nr:hypothetical protein [Ruegeria faecimaris]